MNRLAIIGVWMLALLALGPVAHAQQAPPTIGFLSFVSPLAPYVAEYQKALAALGYVEGRTLRTVFRMADGKPDIAHAMAAELVRLGVRLIVANEGVSTQAALAATRDIPIVIILGINLPETRSDRIASLARPGGNVTGLDRPMVEIGAKRLDLLKEILPSMRRITMLADGATTTSGLRGATVNETERGARALGIAFSAITVTSQSDIDRAFTEAIAGKPDALIFESGAYLSPTSPRLAELAMQHRIAAVHTRREFPEAGGLMSYGPDYFDVYRRAAHYVDRILRGADPAELPIERPTRFELVLNLKAANALGIEIPRSFLARVDEVIE